MSEEPNKATTGALHLFILIAPMLKVPPQVPGTPPSAAPPPGAAVETALIVVAAIDLENAAQLAPTLIARQFPAADGWVRAGDYTGVPIADELVRQVAASLNEQRVVLLP